MSVLSKLKSSRKKWKSKSISRSKEKCDLKKEIARLKKERDKYKSKNKELEKQLEREKKKSLPTAQKVDVVYVALQLFIEARISFRATSRVLEIFKELLGINSAPSHQTIINWVQRLCIARLNSIGVGVNLDGHNGSNGFVWMIDTSIGIGDGKILAVLAVDLNHHHVYDCAPGFQHVQCVSAAVSASWTGENIANFLTKVIASLGKPAAFLKDGGADLEKAVAILNEKGISCPSIDDISHKMANLIKHEYGEDPMFDVFISSCGQVSKNLKQTVLACLAPPKVSTKSRFMNVHKLVTWANKLLQHSIPGRAADGSLLQKLRSKLDQLPQCKSFIQRFIRDVTPILDCQKILKQKGLSQQTYEKCQELIKSIPAHSPIRNGFTAWADKQLACANQLQANQEALPISTDQLESLFGLAKKHGTGDVKDANRIAMRLPILCGGKLTKDDAYQVLSVSCEQQQEFIGALPSSVTSDRRRVLDHPGELETLTQPQESRYLELIPGPKSDQKNGLSDCNIECFTNSTGTEQNGELLPEPILKTGT